MILLKRNYSLKITFVMVENLKALLYLILSILIQQTINKYFILFRSTSMKCERSSNFQNALRNILPNANLEYDGFVEVMNFGLCTHEVSRLIGVFNYSPNILSKYKLQIRKLRTMGPQIKRGALVVFEGLDRSGKSTQSRLLVESLKKSGKEAELMVFPDRSTPIGKIIGSYLSNKVDVNDKALHLLFTANRFEKMNNIKKLLYSGVNVVVDRYSFSGIVFSSAKNGMDPDWCKIPESGLPAPDVVFFLHLPFNDMRSRPGFGHERYETVSFQSKVLQEYEHLASEFNFTKIEAKDSIENIQNNVLNHALKIIDVVEGTDLHYFDFIEKEMESYQKENVSMTKII